MVFSGIYLPHTCFAQIARPSATRFIRVFDDDGNEVFSVDVYTSAYYFLADSGVCVCLCEVGMCAYVCVYVCVHVNGHTGRQTCVHTCVHACVYTNLPGCLYHYAYMYILYLQVLLLLLHSAQLSQLPSPFLVNGYLESLIYIRMYSAIRGGGGVTDTGSYFVPHLSLLLNDAWLIVWLISFSAKKLLS